MAANLMDIKSDPQLLSQLRRSAGAQSQEAVQEQRVSYVFGLLSSKSAVTKERVRQVLANQESGIVQGAK